MKTTQSRHPSTDVPPEETYAEASRAFESAQLRLLMKEREEVVTRLAALDFRIRTLEEFLRKGGS